VRVFNVSFTEWISSRISPKRTAIRRSMPVPAPMQNAQNRVHDSSFPLEAAGFRTFSGANQLKRAINASSVPGLCTGLNEVSVNAVLSTLTVSVPFAGFHTHASLWNYANIVRTTSSVSLRVLLPQRTPQVDGNLYCWD
jgi:hypothetical protein